MLFMTIYVWLTISCIQDNKILKVFTRNSYTKVESLEPVLLEYEKFKGLDKKYTVYEMNYRYILQCLQFKIPCSVLGSALTFYHVYTNLKPSKQSFTLISMLRFLQISIILSSVFTKFFFFF